jgi:hypothetical protein
MLPNAQQATVDPSKVRDYLLSPTHPIGHFKAVVFNALGYTVEHWPLLAQDLIALARSESAVPGHPSPYGVKYEVSGKLTGPNGRSAKFTTVWMLKTGESIPRFVTATPE